MSALNSRVDIIVLGATGFTGRYVVKKLASVNNEADYSDVTWGIAGRSKEKLRDLVKEMEDQGVDVKQIPVIECDITNEAMVHEVCRRAKVVVNSTGPCTVLSEPVVKACIQAKTHYVDISAELHHMLNLYRSYHKAAEEANVLIISACGFGSIPGVMGFVRLEKHFNGTLQTVECYTEIEMPKRVYSLKNVLCGGDNCLVHYGTWDSLVYELKNFPVYFRNLKETFPEPIYGPEPQEMKKSLLRRYPRFFTAGFMSHKGPSEENMHDTKYNFVLSGKGWNKNENKTMHLKVSGSHPYEATAIAFIFSAITILRDNSHMPKGGVLTSGSAFYETKLIERLNCHGINFELIFDGVPKYKYTQ